ncbi:MAG TPA: [Fe-Fe] hydrogenase large subunit C-terminal domain-containing protein [Bacteroidales bacterium]|nr:[Fe-Fe] hydrogenase large subunit C-terminal domain-containing protein [Bacteroidales bacterium]
MVPEPLVNLDEKLCTKCYACVRTCPVKAIHLLADDSFPQVNNNWCIGCGDCIKVCEPGALSYRSSIDEARQLFESGDKIVALVSPSIAAEFDDISDHRKFVTMIKSLGVHHVHEISFAIDLLAYKYLSLLNDFRGRYYIASIDPVVVNFIEKFHPNLISNLTPLQTPMITMAKIVRSIYTDDIKILYIGPQIATKNEALRHDGDGRVDVVITFEELRKLFAIYSIDESNLEFSSVDGPISYKGSLFPLTNGFAQAADMDENLLTASMFSIEGKEAMLSAIAQFEANITTIQRHFYISFGNGLDGPGMTKRGNRWYKEFQVIKYANKRIQNFFRVEWYDNLQKYMELDLTRTFNSDDQRLPMPGQEKIAEILRDLGKPENNPVACLECGYSSCIDFARDIANGITIPEMCISYARRSSKQFESSLHELNEKLAQARKALKESEAKTKFEKESASQASELTNAMLEKLRAGVVIVDHLLKIVKANATFTTILGEEAEQINEVIPGLTGADLNKLVPSHLVNLFSYVISENESIENRDIKVGDELLNVSIFPIEKGKIAGGIIRDMRAPEVQRAEVINRITEVIDRNLEMVQKIGFLLGEGATDIEHMLNSIIEFYKGEGHKK